MGRRCRCGRAHERRVEWYTVIAPRHGSVGDSFGGSGVGGMVASTVSVHKWYDILNSHHHRITLAATSHVATGAPDGPCGRVPATPSRQGRRFHPSVKSHCGHRFLLVLVPCSCIVEHQEQWLYSHVAAVRVHEPTEHTLSSDMSRISCTSLPSAEASLSPCSRLTRTRLSSGLR